MSKIEAIGTYSSSNMRRLCTASMPASEATSLIVGVVAETGEEEEERADKKSFEREKDEEKGRVFLPLKQRERVEKISGRVVAEVARERKGRVTDIEFETRGREKVSAFVTTALAVFKRRGQWKMNGGLVI